MSTGPDPTKRAARWVTALVIAAAVWSVALLLGALTLPAYSSTSTSTSIAADGATTSTVTTTNHATLVAENGSSVLLLVALPLLATFAVWRALRRQRRHGRTGAGVAAWSTVVLLGVFALLGMMTIGVFVMPVVVLLAAACAVAEADGRAPVPAARPTG